MGINMNMKDIEDQLKNDISEFQNILVDKLQAVAPIDTGELYKSIRKVDDTTVEFLRYGLYTSEGTSNIRATHWVERGIDSAIPEFQRILKR